MTEKTDCRTPNPDRPGVTRIPTWKYDLVRSAILEALRSAGEDGLTLSELRDDLRDRIAAEDVLRLGSLSWHMTTVKLNMEVLGDFGRVKNSSPQRVTLR